MPDFFGRVAAAAQWDSFRLSETLYARGAFLPWHRHEESYVTFVLAGGYRERSRAQTRACGARTLVLHPAGDAHEDDFAAQPTRCLNVVLHRAFVQRARRGGGCAASRGGCRRCGDQRHCISIGRRTAEGRSCGGVDH